MFYTQCSSRSLLFCYSALIFCSLFFFQAEDGIPYIGVTGVQTCALPISMLDGIALTSLRTAAISALAVDALSAPDASRLVVFGTGPQARSHIAAIRAIRPVREVTVIGDRKSVV